MTATKHISPQPVELLAPARTADVGRAAVLAGADAVYIGPESFGARAAAGNSIADIASLCDFAHRFEARVYVTVNTIIYDRELRDVERLIRNLYLAGVDALIVQDLGLLRLDLPPIDLHASTQTDIRTPERARFMEQLGFSQLVLPREMSLTEIRAVSEAVGAATRLEGFVHGALCVSYSGDCHAGQLLMGRSANRGECPQVCRLPFDLVDGDGRTVEKSRHLLSLRDMNRSAVLLPMLEAGISSFKIEGRLKDEGYVKNVVAHYRRALDAIIDADPERWRRQSAGTVTHGFTPQLDKSFNRGFTDYFIKGPSAKMASVDTPKSRGEEVGRVVRAARGRIEARLTAPLANGDGLCYFDADRRFVGFRLNRVEGATLFPASDVVPPAGAVLYRNSDRLHDEQLARSKGERTIALDMTLRVTPSGVVALDLSDGRGYTATATYTPDTPLQQARTPQEEARRRTLARLGDTVYRLRSLDDRGGDAFIPAAQLSDLRRKAVALLDATARARYDRPLRRQEQPDAVWPGAARVDYHENVANGLARRVLLDHGVKEAGPAAEVKVPGGQPVVMTTRYCLRRELGACLKTPAGKRLKGPLKLVGANFVLGLEFDCARCGMTVRKL